MTDISNLFSEAELRRLLNPRVNRRVTTSILSKEWPLSKSAGFLGFATFFVDGWSAAGTVFTSTEGGPALARWTTAWSSPQV